MECQRCHGFMVEDRAYDLQNSPLHCEVWRCIACGNMVDSVIVRNRNHMAAYSQTTGQQPSSLERQAA